MTVVQTRRMRIAYEQENNLYHECTGGWQMLVVFSHTLSK